MNARPCSWMLLAKFGFNRTCHGGLGGTCRFVGDVKYKATKVKGKSPDLHSLDAGLDAGLNSGQQTALSVKCARFLFVLQVAMEDAHAEFEPPDRLVDWGRSRAVTRQRGIGPGISGHAHR